MATTGSRQYRTRGTYGGSRRVFYTPAEHLIVSVENGGILDPACSPSVGGKIYAGDFGYFDHKTGVVSHLKTFKLAKALTGTDTEVYFEAGEYSQNPDGVIVMKAPTTASGTGSAAAITASMDTMGGASIYKATITAGSLGTGLVGDIFVEAASAGASKGVKLPKINAIFGGDINILLPLASSDEYWGKSVDGINLYYKAVLHKDAVNIPAYVEVLNKMSNNDQIFEL